MKAKGKVAKARKLKGRPETIGQAKYPRHSVERSLRIPRAILEQNAGKECSERESATYVGVGYNGPYKVEISSSIKYGFLARPKPGYIEITPRARKALRPQQPQDVIEALREAVLSAPDISDVYTNYRGENLPDGTFFTHALVDKFSIPLEKVGEFTEVFLSSLESAHLIEKKEDKTRVLDVGDSARITPASESLKKIGQGVKVTSGDSCFVIMPFAQPIGAHYQQIYEPAIQRAGIKPVRADADIFGAGKIVDQIWRGINNAKVLVAELTNRNPNVFYELGLAHALKKPVVLVSSNESDVPFDLRHIRVIYYDVNDPFWGQKLIDKVAENILSALKNPEEAIFERALGTSD